MSEQLPYEEQLTQQWNDLPLPDEDMAWADMKRRLDEDDDDRFIPFWLRGCALWGLLAVLLTGLGWWIVRPEKWFKENTKLKTETVAKEKENTRPSVTIPGEKNKGASSAKVETNKPDSNSEHRVTETISGQKNKREITPPGQDQTTVKQNQGTKKITSITALNQTLQKRKDLIAKKEKKKNLDQKNPLKDEEAVVKLNTEKKTDGNDKQITDSLKDLKRGDTGKLVTEPTAMVIKRTDTAKTKEADSLAQKKTGITKIKEPSKDSAKSKSISFAAGLALQQQLPINGQKLVPYNAEGRKGNLADYIPSVYLRMYKNKKWFIQAEFRYGAPQYTKEFLYNQERDSVQGITNVTSNTLKKTFYHQLPVSFNYFVSRNWSVGAGLVWNKFVGAVSAQDKILHNNNSGTDSVISKGVIIHSKERDSAFVKSYFQAVLESQYRWKRFSLGARYSFGLQPYIKFTLPGGVQQQEKNSSLQIFLRYELWRSKKN
jgi:hypothetical protein